MALVSPEPVPRPPRPAARLPERGGAVRLVAQPAAQVLALQRAAGNRAAGAWLATARRAQVQRVGLLSQGEAPPPNASAGYATAATRAGTLREQYARLKDGTASVLDWLDNLPFIVEGWAAGAAEADAKDLYRRLEADIGRTKEGWLETEQKLVAAYKQYVDNQAAELKPKAEDRAFLMKRWLDLRDADGKLEGPGARRGLSARTRDDMLWLFRRLRNAVAELLGQLDAKRHQRKPLKEVRLELLAASNAYRKTKNADPLELHPALNAAAQGHAAYLAQPGSPFGHAGEAGSSPNARIGAEKYYGMGTAENVAHAQASGDAAVAAWIKSPGHEANLVDRSMKHVGFGYATDTSGRNVWVQVFGAPKS